MENQTLQVYNSLCEAMRDMEFAFDKKEEELIILSGVQGEDLPMPFMIRVSDDKQLVSFVSVVPVEVNERAKKTVIVALNEINMYLLDGCFAYDEAQAHIMFRSALTYRDALIGKGALKKMIMLSLSAVEAYNDKIQKIVTKEMTIQEAIEFLK